MYNIKVIYSLNVSHYTNNSKKSITLCDCYIVIDAYVKKIKPYLLYLINKMVILNHYL